MVGEEPEIIAVMRSQAIHQHRDLALLSDAAGAADKAVWVCGDGDHQRVARPSRQMRVQDGDRGVGPTSEHKFEEPDVTGFALGQPLSYVPGRCQRRSRSGNIALSHQHLSLTGMGQREIRIGGDGR
jgi:hypothetical protein